MLREAKDFAHQPSNAVARDGVTNDPGRDRQAEPRISARIGAGRDLEERLTTSLPAFVDMLELRLGTEALAGAERVRPDRNSAAALRCETLASLGAPAAQHLPPLLRRHARAKSMGSLAPHFAWLISTLHPDGSRFGTWGGRPHAKGGKGTQHPKHCQYTHAALRDDSPVANSGWAL